VGGRGRWGWRLGGDWLRGGNERSTVWGGMMNPREAICSVPARPGSGGTTCAALRSASSAEVPSSRSGGTGGRRLETPLHGTRSLYVHSAGESPPCRSFRRRQAQNGCLPKLTCSSEPRRRQVGSWCGREMRTRAMQADWRRGSLPSGRSSRQQWRSSFPSFLSWSMALQQAPGVTEELPLNNIWQRKQ